MENGSVWKNWLAIVLHQLGAIVAILSLFAAEYYIKASGASSAISMIVVGAFGLLVAFVMMGYLASATSSYSTIDKIGGDVLIVIFTLAVLLIVDNSLRLKLNRFSISDKLVAIGVITFVYDTVFLVFFLSIVRRIKKHKLWATSVVGQLWNYVSKGLFKRSMMTRALRGLIAWAIAILGAAIIFIYQAWWGAILIALSAVIELFFSLRKAQEQKEIREAILEITNGNLETTLEVNNYHGEEKYTAEAVNHIRDGLDAAVEAGIKNEKLKAELITNVSHDLKTPLTSIINYVGILKREVKEPQAAIDHVEILEEKSQRMKLLVEDLVDVSRITSGNMKYEIAKFDFVELIYQAGGEFDDRFEKRELKIVSKLSRLPLYIEADGRQLFRCVENLYTNAAKYALHGSTVHVNLYSEDDEAIFEIRNKMENVPETENLSGDLTERFVRGDKARSTEGSGLGLSIAKNMVEQMGGRFEILIEQDQFIARITYKIS